MSSQELDWRTAAWAEARRRYPDLSTLITLEEGLYAAQRAMAEFVPEIEPLDEASLRAAWAQGNPAFPFDDLRIDWGIFSQISAWLGGIVVTGLDPMSQGEASWQVSQLAQADPAELSWLARGVYEGASQGDFEDNVVAAALKPFLWQARKAIQPLFESATWPHGWCPLCGAGPDFATLADTDGPRTLYCSRCDFDWPYRRVGCPFCGNTNQRRLTYCPTDDECYRLYLCEDCRRYLKTMDLRQSHRDPFLPLERVVTFSIDQMVKENGYT